MLAIARCFVKPEDNISRFLLTIVDIIFKIPSDVLSTWWVHCNGWKQYR